MEPGHVCLENLCFPNCGVETLEEIGMRAGEDFVEAGGEDLRLVPSLNATPGWIDLAARLVRRAAWPRETA